MSRPVDAWAFTSAISPRDVVRVSDQVDAGGHLTNSYAVTAPLDGEVPSAPWAMYLASAAGYRFLCFDLDAGAGNAPYDAGRLELWLDELNVPSLTTASGPTGGRHVWVAFDHDADPSAVRAIAQLAKQLLPSLDISPLTNAATGCVRPPGAPHRLGGISTPIRGRLEQLEHGTVTAEQLDLLLQWLLELGAELPTATPALLRGMRVDEDGHPHLTGSRRDPSPRIRALLSAPAVGDASVTQAVILAGCARARWRFEDLLPHLNAGGLDHARTRPGPNGRTAVPHAVAVRRLAADWSRAVYYVAANPIAAEGHDDSFTTRAEQVTAAVLAADSDADRSPGRWGGQTAANPAHGLYRFSDRAVLRAVCLYLVQAARADVEVDIRRLAQDTGYGREACRLALHALTTPTNAHDPESSWLVLTTPAAGIHGARYRLPNRFSTPADTSKWSQADTRPAGPGRTWLLNHLQTGLALPRTDTFAAPRSLGRTSSRILTALRTAPLAPLHQLIVLTGLTAAATRRGLNRLAAVSVVERIRGGWRSTTDDQVLAAAVELDVDGFLQRRTQRYELERQVWGWWQAELHWLQRRGKRGRRRQASDAAALFAGPLPRDRYPRYPRNQKRRADHQRARELIEAGILDPTTLTPAAERPDLEHPYPVAWMSQAEYVDGSDPRLILVTDRVIVSDKAVKRWR